MYPQYYMINKFRTSQICPTCFRRLCPTTKILPNGKKRHVRGKKWCNYCKRHPFLVRDGGVACPNVFHVATAEHVHPMFINYGQPGYIPFRGVETHYYLRRH